MNYYNVIDDIVKNNTKKKYDNILEYNKILSDNSKSNIKNIFENKKTEKLEEKKKETKEYFNLIYQNYWHKLKPIHQKNKLEEYINNLPTDEDNKKKILENVFTAVDEKILTKKVNVEYDHTVLLIKNIKGLKYDETNKTYTFSL